MKRHTKEHTQTVFEQIINEYLLPLTHDAKVEGPQKQEGKGPGGVSFETKHKLRISLEIGNDAATFTLKRTVPFSCEEKDFFAGIVDGMHAGGMPSATSYHHFLNGIIERAIADYVNKSCAETIYDILQVYSQWAAEVYEGERIAHTVGIHSTLSRKTGRTLGGLRNTGAMKLLGAAPGTILVTDAEGAVSGIENISAKLSGYEKNRDVLAPVFLSDTAMWTNSRHKTAIRLTANGEILIFKNKALLFAKRRSMWRCFPHQALLESLLSEADTEEENMVKKAVYLTVLDMAFSGRGACIGVIPPLSEKKRGSLPTPPGALLHSSTPTPATEVIRCLIGGKKFFDLPRKIRVSLCCIDGAVLLDASGAVQAVGAILKTNGSTDGGGRTAAAQTLGENGIGIKVSHDGFVDIYAHGKYHSRFA